MRLLSAILGAVTVLVVGASTGSATTIGFGAYTSTNPGDAVSPWITVSDDPAGSFLVTATMVGPSDGHLNLIGFDLGVGLSFAPTDITNVMSGGGALIYQTPCTNTGNTQVSAGNYCVGDAVPLGGNSNDVNPLDTSNIDIVLAFYNNDAVGSLTNTLTFNLSDQGGTLSLDDFEMIALRYQSSNNVAGSDKLIGSPNGPVFIFDTPPVPLPASGLLLAGVLAGFGLARRRKTQ